MTICEIVNEMYEFENGNAHCNTNVYPVMAVYKYKWSCFVRSVIYRNCTLWHFPRAYDFGNKINQSIPSGISKCVPHTTFCGNQMLCNVPQFRHLRASLYKNITPRKIFLL